MRVIKLLSVLFIIAFLSVSCEKEANGSVVFFSKDKIKNELFVQINDTEGNVVTVNSSTTITLFSSPIFKENAVYLKEVSVPKMYFRIKNFQNSLATLSNVQVFVDEIQITDDMGVDFLQSSNNNVEIEITNQSLLDVIASKLLQSKQIVISYKSDAVSANSLNFDFEFGITAVGTFVD